jgi:RNA polymerase sigma-70 factor (ECF subfamily)
LETLLSHRDWVRRLARSLVRDESSADDVEQRTWLAALRRPPRDAETSRAWLGRVVRNLATDARRARVRRESHEATAARPEGARSTADVVAESEAHMRVVVRVHELDEPYRTTVLLRWFEDLPPRTVAERMGVPVETVRTRLRRAHETLRGRLGRGAGGGSDWMAALAPLTGLKSSAGGLAAKPAGVLGGAAMGTKTAVAVAAGVAVAAAFVGGTMVRDGEATAAREESDARVAALVARIDALESARNNPSERTAAPTLDRRAAAIEERAAAQDARVVALEARLADVTRQLAAADAAAVERRAAPAPARDAAAERQRLGALTDDELLQTIRDLVAAKGADGRSKIDGQAVLDACALLLARPLDAPRRAETLTLKGIGHRVLGERAAEEAAFRDAVNVAGPNSKEGRSATAQLAWTAARGGDSRGAAETFLRLSQDVDAPAVQRAWNRLYAATHFEQAGDKERASIEYRGVVDEYGSSADRNVLGAVTEARSSLERIAKAAK